MFADEAARQPLVESDQGAIWRDLANVEVMRLDLKAATRLPFDYFHDRGKLITAHPSSRAS